MHENNFEKQVREKMEHLGFDPSDAVWAGVDKEINKEKKRRRPLFWLFLFSGLALGGGGYYIATLKNSSGKTANTKTGSIINNKADGQTVNQPEISQDEKSEKNNAVKKLSEGNSKNQALSNSFQTAKARENALVSKKENPVSQNTDKRLNEDNLKDSIHSNSGNDEFIPAGVAKEVQKTDSSAANTVITAALIKPSSKDSVTSGKMTAEKDQKKKSAWKIGFTSNAGVSNINQGLFNSAYTNYPAYSANSPGNPNSGGMGAYYGSSDLNSGFSFGAGVFTTRNLSKFVSFTVGLNYRYYSTKINTSNKVDSSIYVYTGSVQASPVNSFYRNTGNKTYINQYHFIELPLAVSFQLNKNSKTPVSWEAGLSLAYLINSNALQFDPYSNVYYKNNQLLNKTQLNTETAILIGFSVHHAELQLGPQLQYGLTGLLKGSTASPEHLFYYGLKVSLIPRNK
jgi:hypothetical protein